MKNISAVTSFTNLVKKNLDKRHLALRTQVSQFVEHWAVMREVMGSNPCS